MDEKAVHKLAIERTQNFIGVLDALAMNMTAADDLLRVLRPLYDSLSKDLPAAAAPAFEKISQWYTRLQRMQAAEQLGEEDTRQMRLDVEQAYETFKQA